MLPEKLQKKIEERQASHMLRTLHAENDLIDLSSNDYLGFSKNYAFAKAITKTTNALLKEYRITGHGATGSRLLSGNHALYALAEDAVAQFHKTEGALIFNSGYGANIGFFQSVPQRGDVILYDAYIHASIRDGIWMSQAKAYKFTHNSLEDLTKALAKHSKTQTSTTTKDSSPEIYVVTESVFSMDGDNPDLFAIVKVCEQYGARLVIDEAHATGVMGVTGQGLVQLYELQDRVFARLVTFGKALGTHGAAILCSEALKTYLVNFARSFIYTTALPPQAVGAIIAAYKLLVDIQEKSGKDQNPVTRLRYLINVFRSKIEKVNLGDYFIPSNAAIQCAVVPGNVSVKALAQHLQEQGFDVKPILSPTVPQGQERLRICLHSFNTKEDVHQVLELLQKYLKP